MKFSAMIKLSTTYILRVSDLDELQLIKTQKTEPTKSNSTFHITRSRIDLAFTTGSR
jgi:hypothetical protein